MTRSDIDFVERLVADKLERAPLHWTVPAWFSVLAAGAVVIGATLGLLT